MIDHAAGPILSVVNISIAPTLRAIGPLRLGLAVIALLVVMLMPTPGSGVVTEGWNALTSVVVPAITPLLIMIYLLDVLMARVLMKDRTGPERRRYRWVIASDLVLTALLLAAFLPVVLALRR